MHTGRKCSENHGKFLGKHKLSKCYILPVKCQFFSRFIYPNNDFLNIFEGFQFQAVCKTLQVFFSNSRKIIHVRHNERKIKFHFGK